MHSAMVTKTLWVDYLNGVSLRPWLKVTNKKLLYLFTGRLFIRNEYCSCLCYMPALHLVWEDKAYILGCARLKSI